MTPYLVASLVVLCVFLAGLAVNFWFEADEARNEVIHKSQAWAEDSQSLVSQLKIKDAEIKRLTMQLQPTPVLPLSTSIDTQRQLANAGIKPAAVMEAEYDLVGAGLGCCANSCTCGPIRKPTREVED